MRVLKMQPQRVFYYFEEISKIPRGSGNTKAVSDFCVQFAKENNLRYIQDEINNVIIYKEGTKGRENEEPVIVQGHLDMVCEKNLDCDHDFEKEGLKLLVEGDFIYADQTTLGGDDGIAVAYGLALLESTEISHPPLEVVFTVDEETGMFGAKALDSSVLKGKRLLNIDSEEEGVLLTSCAGGMKCHCVLPVTYTKEEQSQKRSMKIVLKGLLGGHSGTEIDKGRCNANKLMGRLLFALRKEVSFEISQLSGGLQDNAIPREACMVLTFPEDKWEFAEENIKEFELVVKRELGGKEPDFSIDISSQENPVSVLSAASARLVIFLLMQVPNGVQEMSSEIEGMVETSLNLGIMRLDEDCFTMDFALRSSVRTAKEALRDKLDNLMEFAGGSCIATGDYPAWEYNRDSAFRPVCTEAFRQTYGKEPQVMALHAGLECGILADKIERFDAVSMGPNIFDIHTPKERMSITSAARTWEYLINILKLA